MKTIVRLTAIPVFGLLSAACIADPAWDQEGEIIDEDEQIEEAEEALSCSSIGSTVVDHACWHATNGLTSDDGSVTANANAAFTTANPNVNTAHTWWTVTLPGSGSSYAGTVKFRPTVSGDYVFFVKDSNATVTLMTDGGSTITPDFAVSVAGCTEISRAIGEYLTAYTTYRITLSDTTAAQNLIIERLNGCNNYY
ncbi:hypothetical protein AB3662_29410 [Sorangium cellulosum]|uniref:hypothetical protein n=1 Tax=Sorangium cellulosum TaxID=56 RepID=UPI003D9A45CB